MDKSRLEYETEVIKQVIGYIDKICKPRAAYVKDPVKFRDNIIDEMLLDAYMAKTHLLNHAYFRDAKGKK